MTDDSGNVTGDSGEGPESVTFNQNSRSRSAGTAGHVQSESAVNFTRNTQLLFCVELLLWALYGVFELFRALFQRRKPRPVPKPVIWRPAKLKRSRNVGSAEASKDVVSVQLTEK